MLIDIEKVKVSDRIRKDFGDLQELAEDIKQNGLINPPVVTPNNYELIAGERRLRAMKLLGYKQIEVRPMTVKDGEHALNLEISENENRKDFSKSERIDYAKRLERIERIKAKERMLNPTKNSSEGETLQIVAEKLNIGSKDTYRKEKYIVENQSSLTPQDFSDWDDGKLSTNKAYMRIKQEKENQSMGGGDKKSALVNLPKAVDIKPINTSEKLASIAGVSEKTYRMGAKVLNSDNEDVKERVLNGETSISVGYKELTQKTVETNSECNSESPITSFIVKKQESQKPQVSDEVRQICKDLKIERSQEYLDSMFGVFGIFSLQYIRNR